MPPGGRAPPSANPLLDGLRPQRAPVPVRTAGCENHREGSASDGRLSLGDPRPDDDSQLVSRTGRLAVVLVANLALVGALVTVGIDAHSLGVFAEGADYLADAAAIAVSLFAIRLARRPPTPRRPKGYPRATRYAALVNAGWLLVLTLLVTAGATERLAGGVRRVDGLPVLVVSGVAALVMLGGALVLGGDVDEGGAAEESPGDDAHGEAHEHLNVRAVLLDTAADSAAAAGVAVSGGIIYATHGTYWLDPAVALLLALVVAYSALRLLQGVVASLRGSPRPR